MVVASSAIRHSSSNSWLWPPKPPPGAVPEQPIDTTAGSQDTESLSAERRDDRAAAAMVAMLAQPDALPSAEGEPAVADRDGQRHAEEQGFDVRRHVVGALGGVD